MDFSILLDHIILARKTSTTYDMLIVSAFSKTNQTLKNHEVTSRADYFPDDLPPDSVETLFYGVVFNPIIL
nr:hypothetical protein [uncultured Desulfobacter sp.]